MSDSQQYVIELTVIKGNYFPPNESIVAECSLGILSTSTEPSDNNNNNTTTHNNNNNNNGNGSNNGRPVWNHQFKWELSKKKLADLKTARVPIKISFYIHSGGGDGHTNTNNHRPLLGYLVLSLREGGNNENAKWMPLLNPPKSCPNPMVSLLSANNMYQMMIL